MTVTGFENEVIEIELDIEDLEKKQVPQSTAGFLE
jgi:hypothetical protein